MSPTLPNVTQASELNRYFAAFRKTAVAHRVVSTMRRRFSPGRLTLPRNLTNALLRYAYTNPKTPHNAGRSVDVSAMRTTVGIQPTLSMSNIV